MSACAQPASSDVHDSNCMCVCIARAAGAPPEVALGVSACTDGDAARFAARMAERFAFLRPDRIMDAAKRRPDHADYDPRTLYIPPGWWVAVMRRAVLCVSCRVRGPYVMGPRRGQTDYDLRTLNTPYADGGWCHAGAEISWALGPGGQGLGAGACKCFWVTLQRPYAPHITPETRCGMATSLQVCAFLLHLTPLYSLGATAPGARRPRGSRRRSVYRGINFSSTQPFVFPHILFLTILLCSTFPRFKEAKITEAQQQWWNIKAANFDSVVLFKVGKFYEVRRQKLSRVTSIMRPS